MTDTSRSAAIDRSGSGDHAPRRPAGPARRGWPFLLLLLGAGLLALTIGPFGMPNHDPTQLVFLGLLQQSWLGLALVAALILLSVAVPTAVHRLLTLLGAWRWARDVVTWLTISAVGAFWVLAWMPLAFVLALGYEETRTIATVDGHDLVVRRSTDWDGDNEIQAGFRSGLLVDFAARGDLSGRGPTGPLGTWTFRVSTHGGEVAIDYGSGDDAGRMQLTRPGDR